MFTGLSSLRAKEKVKKPVSEDAKKLQSYLAQQYGAGAAADGAGEGSKDKKKKKKKKPPAPGGMRILDEDVTGFAAASTAAELAARAAGDEDDEGPVLANPEEAEQLRVVAEREKQFFAKGADGSGWDVQETGAQAGDGSALRQRHDSPDASPPRRQRHDSPDASPPRRQRHGSPDASSPRRQRHDSPDASPPRRQRHGSPDASPPRWQRHDSPDASPPRRQRQGSPDASPPRRPAPGGSPPRKRAEREGGGGEGAEEDAAKRRKMMSDGTIAGMVSGRELVAEMARKREAERARFADLGAEVTGQGAATVYRDRESGRQMSKDEFVAEREKEKAKRAAQYEDESQLAWGGGLKQREEARAAAQALAEEAAKPFARSRDDSELDAMQRDALRWGDPMAHLVKRRQPELDAPPSLVAANAEAMKKSGFVIPLEVPPHSWLRRNLGPPLNRYNIRPGRHWDGVDRSNGFEREMFKSQNAQRARQQEAFYMGQEDM